MQARDHEPAVEPARGDDDPRGIVLGLDGAYGEEAAGAIDWLRNTGRLPCRDR